MMVRRHRGVSPAAASMSLLLCCCTLLVATALADSESGPAQVGVAQSRHVKRSAFIFPSDDEETTYSPDEEPTARANQSPPSLDEDEQSHESRSSSGKIVSFPDDDEQTEVVVPAAGTGRNRNGRVFFRRPEIAKDGASGSGAQLMQTLSALVSLLPTAQKEKDAAADTTTRQAFDGFSLANLMPDGLSALEGLDDLLRSTVPRMDRFNCLERVMCEMAAPLGNRAEGGGNFLEDGVQTLQQISNSPLLQQFPDRFLQQGPQQPQFQQQQQQFIRPHQQQFQQHQQHQTRLIRQQVHQQQQQQHQQVVQPQHLPQQPVIPPLPYYIPTPVETSQQQFREQQQENLVARASSSEERTQYDNTIRRDERHPTHQYQYQQQHQPSQQVYQYQNHPSQRVQRQQYQTNRPYQYQQASRQHPQYASQNAPPQRRRRQPPAWRRLLNNFMGVGPNNPGGPNRRRGKRDTEDEETPKPRSSSRQSKIAPVFKSEEGKVKSVPTRQSKVSPAFKSTDVAGSKRKEEGPAPVKTLTKKDLDDIRKKIAAINKDVLQNAHSNGTSSVTFQGRQYSGRQARFLDTLLNGWTAKSLLGVLDNLMDGYSFHPYTHAAYMGYTSRSGTCSSMYPKCPDSANDMLDLINNLHRYFPGGIPFRDSIPWPLNLLIP